MKLKNCQNIFNVTVNTSSIVEHVTKIKNEIMIYANASVKGIAHAKKIKVGILSHLFVRIASI